MFCLRKHQLKSATIPRLTAKSFPQELLDYYGYYTHRKISKRESLSLAAKYAMGGMTALALFNLLKPSYTLATQVEFTDPEIVAEYIMYPSPDGRSEVRGYLVKPAKVSSRAPTVVVVHENCGLNPYIEDMVRRVAKAGYIALAPDDLSSIGGYPGNNDKGRELQQQIDPTKLMNDFFAVIEFMQRYPQATGKVGVTGFCHSGGISNAVVVAYSELACAVPFYGRQAPTADVAKIGTPLLLRFVEPGIRINEGWPAYETALEANSKVYGAYIYSGVNYGFHNDSALRYDRSVADPAQQRTLKWFDKYLFWWVYLLLDYVLNKHEKITCAKVVLCLKYRYILRHIANEVDDE